MNRNAVVCLFACVILIAMPAAAFAQQSSERERQTPLPHYDVGKVREYDPDSYRELPYAVTPPSFLHGPPAGAVTPPPEFDWSAGILLRWGDWNNVLTELCQHAADAANDSKVYMYVKGASQQASCTATLTAAGVDMNQVEFLIGATDSIWIRDYGPHFIWEDGTRGIVDSHYYSSRPKDNSIPYKTAKIWYKPLYDIPLMYSGGNFLCTSDDAGYMSNIIYNDNPGLGLTVISDLFLKYQGVTTLHIFPAFPYTIDGTGHIDMWMAILSDDTVIIGEYPSSNPNYQAYVITENAVTYMQNLGFNVFRVPGHNSGPNGYNGVHYTYTNGIILNNKIIISRFGGTHAANDATALATFQAAMPGHTVVSVDSSSIIPAAGALHCICMHVPAYLASEPAIKVLSPNGGELWAAEQPRDIQWNADDDEEVTAVDLLYSMDGGATFPYTIALGEPHDGIYEGWVSPWARSRDCVVKAVAHDANLNQASDESDAEYFTDFMTVKLYDYSAGAGVDKWAYGYYTDSWNEDLAGQRMPAECSTEVDQLQANAYTRLAYSDATGGTTDANRYENPQPGGGNESTLIAVFKIEEKPIFVRSLEFLWEGFANQAQHMELYVWDYVAGDWCDGKGNYGVNNFMDNASHKNDRIMRGAITLDPKRCIDGNGEVTFLIYCDKTNFITYHDYMSLTVQSIPFEVKGQSM